MKKKQKKLKDYRVRAVVTLSEFIKAESTEHAKEIFKEMYGADNCIVYRVEGEDDET